MVATLGAVREKTMRGMASSGSLAGFLAGGGGARLFFLFLVLQLKKQEEESAPSLSSRSWPARSAPTFISGTGGAEGAGDWGRLGS